MNLILKFPSPAAREQFLERARREEPEIVKHGHLATRRPDAVLESLTPEQAQRVKGLLQGLGEAFSDLEFKTLGG